MGEPNDDKKAWSGYFSCSVTPSASKRNTRYTKKEYRWERENIHTENREKRMRRREYREKVSTMNANDLSIYVFWEIQCPELVDVTTLSILVSKYFYKWYMFSIKCKKISFSYCMSHYQREVRQRETAMGMAQPPQLERTPYFCWRGRICVRHCCCVKQVSTQITKPPNYWLHARANIRAISNLPI